MAQVSQTICDGCGKIKGETNHWFCVLDNTGPESIRFTTVTSDYPDIKNLSLKDYCGQECVIKAFQEWLNKQQFKKELDESVAEALKKA